MRQTSRTWIAFRNTMCSAARNPRQTFDDFVMAALHARTFFFGATIRVMLAAAIIAIGIDLLLWP